MPLATAPRRAPSAVVHGTPTLLVPAGVAAAAALLWVERVSPHRALLLTLGVGALLALVLLALLDLERLVLTVVFCSMVFPQSLISPAGAHVALSDLLIVFALGTWLAWFAVHRQPVAWLRANPYLAPAAVYAIVTVLSLLWSTNWHSTAKQAIQISEFVVVVPVLFASVPRSLDRIRSALVAYVVFAAGLSAVVFSFFISRAIGGDVSPEYLPGMHKNATGGFLGVACVLTYGLWLEGRRGSRWVIWLLPLEVAGLFGTISRGSLIGAAAALLLLTLLLRRRIVLTVAAGVAATAVFLVTIESKLPVGGYSSASVRPHSWADGIHWIEAHPLLGTGAGTYYDVLPKEHIGLTDPNNLFLLTWAELGVVGLLALLVLLLRVARITLAVRQAPAPAAALGITVAAAASSNLVHFQFDTTWARGTATMTFALIGLLLAVVRLSAAPESPSLPMPLPVASERPARKRSLRVLQVVASSQLGTVERHTLELARALRERGLDCRIACPFAAHELRVAAARASVPVTPAAGRGSWLRQVLDVVEANPPHVVHAHDPAGAVAAWQIAEAAGARFVRTQHAPSQPSEAAGWRGWIVAQLHHAIEREPDAVIAVSDAVARSLGAVDTPLAVASSRVELPSDREVERRRRHLPRGAPTGVFAGELPLDGGGELLLLALVRARARRRDLRVHLANLRSTGADLRRRARELGVEQSVVWLGDGVEESETFRVAHFAVAPTAADASDGFLAEAMAWGRPAIAVRPAAGAGVVEHRRTGLVVEPGDVRALGAALVELGSDQALVEELGGAARASAVARFDADDPVARMIDTYESLLRSLPS